jgi:nitrite reductase/ring-hydroxylating ferredoxin subunit
LALAGFGVLTGAGYLGGYLSFARGVNVNHTAFEERPREWTPALADEELATGTSQRVSVGGVEVLLARVDGQVYALANTCTHAGGPLDEGELTGDCVSCPWHGSIFRLADGAVVCGPASIPQPAYEVRVREGKIEVRAAQ